jgi:hypothetical protein
VVTVQAVETPLKMLVMVGGALLWAVQTCRLVLVEARLASVM